MFTWIKAGEKGPAEWRAAAVHDAYYA